MTTRKRGILILSGGLDSTTLLYWLRAEKIELTAISFDYGQRHKRELTSAETITKLLKIPHHLIDLSSLRPILKGSSQTDDIPVPEGHYAEENMKLTVVPNRNMIMLSIAIAAAISEKSPTVFYGAHAGDHAIYPDCRAPFVEAMMAAAKLCDWTPVEIYAPFQLHTKADIVKYGLRLGVPYGLTWTCYQGEEKACGKCGSCTERLEAFAANKTEDPLPYA